MRIGRTLPPAAAPIYFRDIISGLQGLCRGQSELGRFEDELKDYFDVKYCFLVSSGKAALTIILQSLKDIYPDRNQVIIPAFTCYSVPSAIVRAGLEVKLCDIGDNTLDYDLNQLQRIMSSYSLDEVSNNYNKKKSRQKEGKTSFNRSILERPLCIIATDLFGVPANISELRESIKDSDIVILEDAAQALGGSWQGKRLGTLGDISFFSLGRGKVFSTIEGGIIVTNRDDIGSKIELRMKTISYYSFIDMLILLFKSIFLAFFQRPSLFWLPKSLPFLKLGETIYDPAFKMRKMSAFQAGLARNWQKKITNFKKYRSKNSRYWMTILKDKRNIVPINLSAGHLPDIIRFPLKVRNSEIRAMILRESDRLGLGIMPAYPDTINCIKALRDDFYGLEFPVAKECVRKLITLPIHLFVTQYDRAQIAELMTEIKDNTSK
jgi:perosamine synthetase